jgi:methyl-accepting chemotaxis protein
LRYKSPKIVFSIVVLVISICISNNVVFAIDNKASQIKFVKLAGLNEDIKSKETEYLYKFADKLIEMLIAMRGVISKNQNLINRDPISGNYYFKGFVPASVCAEVANDFYLKTGYKLKQTSMKIRNPSNSPDSWEHKVLELFRLPEHSKGVGFGELLEVTGNKMFRYMKPIYIERACLECHGKKGDIKPAIRQYLERKFPFDNAFDYKEGELRGGISISIPLEIFDSR